MATTDIGGAPALGRRASLSTTQLPTIGAIVAALASLQLTVFLFSLSMVLVFAGTLAQIDHDIWHVINGYFRCWLTWIDLQVFFPRDVKVPGAFPFPGGWAIGAAMLVNLLAAHTVRFRVAASGGRLKLGTLLIAVGVALTWAVVRSGIDDTIESELSPQFCNNLWHALRAALGASALTLGYVLALRAPVMRRSASGWLWWIGVVTAVILAGLAAWLFANPQVQLDPSGLRILWQLIKGGAAGMVLLAGCHMVFAHRAGIVLLHGGIGLMMIGELLTGLNAEEAHMRLVEGQTKTYAEDIRSVELALIDRSGERDAVTVLPGPMLKAAAGGETISSPDLPFDIRVHRYIDNATVRVAQPGEQNPADAGAGALYLATEARASTGVDSDAGIDIPAAYVELLGKESGNSIGTYFVSPYLDLLPTDHREVVPGDKPLDLALRFKRIHKDYRVKLLDFERTTYVGTETPKSFRSVVQVMDPDRGVDRTVAIWMNNPLRYAGDTLYQSGWDPRNERYTDLQVVTNRSWMIPYVACMLVATGMLFHFGRAILLFAQRKNNKPLAASSAPAIRWTSPAVLVPTALVMVLAAWVGSRARPPSAAPTEVNFAGFGGLPVAFEGRVQPIDTLARNTLLVISGKQTYADTRFDKDQPAVRWLLDLLADPQRAVGHRVIRITDRDLLQQLGLTHRPGSWRYSLGEVFEKESVYQEQLQQATSRKEEERSALQRAFIRLADKIAFMNILRGAFAAPELDAESQESLRRSIMQLNSQIERLGSRAPLAVPPADVSGPWRSLLQTERDNLFARLTEKETEPAAESLRAILDAYEKSEVSAFNQGLRTYQELVAERADAEAVFDRELAASGEASDRKTTDRLSLDRLRFETFFNGFMPFILAMALYVIAFLLAVLSWLGWPQTLNRSSHAVLWLAFAVHTFGLIARVYISGRPPVTNLHSSAVFVGWGGVLMALVCEQVYRIGVGNVLAAVVGFPTLVIAHNLAGEGDTFKVLQAVLDTQFWLATHVVTITFGYSATLLASALGVFYVLCVHVLGIRTLQLKGGDEAAKPIKLDQVLTRITYGSICFALLLSFIGTVLGGLWADDSWGRFWGWDPKENGALMIVIWNAIVLHARWGGMIRPLGIANLAIFGGVVTAWSWWGVNNLEVGLHSYGFQSGMVRNLLCYVGSMLAVIALGLVPEHFYRAIAARLASARR